MSAAVATIAFEDTVYEVIRMSADPKLYVARMSNRLVLDEALHRDGRSYSAALRMIAAHIAGREQSEGISFLSLVKP